MGVFNFEKDSNGQNHSSPSSDSHHLVKKTPVKFFIPSIHPPGGVVISPTPAENPGNKVSLKNSLNYKFHMI